MFKTLITAAAVLGVTLAVAAPPASAATKVAVLSSSNAWAIAPGATWSWAPITTTSADPRVANDIVQARLQNAVEFNMAAHGLQQTGPAGAQFLVSYHVRLQNRVEPKASRDRACGWRGCVSGWGPATVDLQRYTEGVLVIDILDASTGQLVWRAASERKVSAKDATQARINRMVADMTKTLPSA